MLTKRQFTALVYVVGFAAIGFIGVLANPSCAYPRWQNILAGVLGLLLMALILALTYRIWRENPELLSLAWGIGTVLILALKVFVPLGFGVFCPVANTTAPLDVNTIYAARYLGLLTFLMQMGFIIVFGYINHKKPQN